MSDYSKLAVVVKVPVGMERKETVFEAIRLTRQLKTPVAFEWPPLTVPFTVYPNEDLITAETRLLNLIRDTGG